MKLYMWIDTSNEYLLPLAVTTTVRELACKAGVTENAIYSYITHSVEKGFKRKVFEAVEIDDD